MKKLIISLTLILTTVAFARPGGPGPGFSGGPQHRGPMLHHVGPGPRGNSWGHGGRNFWPGFVGGMVGGIVGTTIVNPPVVTPAPIVVTPTPTVVTPTPTVITPAPIVVAPLPQKVWIEGRYIDQVQPNGTILRVWQAGHWEYR